MVGLGWMDRSRREGSVKAVVKTVAVRSKCDANGWFETIRAEIVYEERDETRSMENKIQRFHSRLLRPL